MIPRKYISRKNQLRIKKWSIITGPILLLVLVMHWGLPLLRTEYEEQKLGLKATRSKHLMMFSNDRKATRRLRREFVQFRSAFTRIFRPHLSLSDRDLIRIYLFPNQSSFETHYENKFQKDLPNNSGFYDPSDRIISTVHTDDQRTNRRSIRHEAVHLFLESGTSARNPRWSPWFNEGISSLFERLRITENGARISGIRKEAFFFLQNAQQIPIRSLFHAKNSHFRSDNNLVYYYESEALVFYLLKQYPEQFWKYFHYEKQENAARPKQFEKIFDMSLSELEKDFKTWLLSFQPLQEQIQFPFHARNTK